tara:strand:- start:310 stop:786 length:477 start_codon:yes stop_codon:yes gene_type:complete
MKLFYNFWLVVLFLIVFSINLVHADHHMSKFGTRQEAKSLLERVVNLMNHDKEYALLMMSIGRGGFYIKDLYPFCANEKGTLTGHPFNVGVNLKTFKDVDGVMVGEMMFKKAKPGKISEVKYKLARLEEGLLTKKIYTKISFVTKVEDHVCAVGYYKK